MTSLSSIADYGKSFQTKLLAALLTDKKFLQSVQDILKLEYFNSPSSQWIIQETLKYYSKYNCCPTIEVLQVEYKKIDNDILKIAVKEELRGAYQSTQDDLAYVKEEFITFCKNQEMKNAILESTDKLKEGDFEGIRYLIEKALKAGVEKDVGHNYKKDVETRYRDDYRPTIQFPWPTLNEIFCGGSGPGDLVLVFGGPGSGKSWLCVAYGAEAIRAGYNVVYYTLELGESYVARRFDSVLTGYSVDELRDHRPEVDKIMDSLPGNLIIKEYPPKTASINTIKAHLQKCKDEGIEPDIIFIDYIDYLRPPRSSKFTERKDEIDDVYVGAKALAKELGIPVVSPSQVNRMGSKDDVVEGDKAAGSYDKMMVADMAMSLSRKKEDKVLGTGRIHIMKNRYGQDGMTFNVRMDTNCGRVEFEGMIDQEDSLGISPTLNSVNGGSYLNKEVIRNFFNK